MESGFMAEERHYLGVVDESEINSYVDASVTVELRSTGVGLSTFMPLTGKRVDRMEHQTDVNQ